MLHLSLLSMNSVNKTQTAIFTLLLYLLLPRDRITRIKLVTQKEFSLKDDMYIFEEMVYIFIISLLIMTVMSYTGGAR